MINVTGLWSNKDKSGNTYLSGRIGGVKVLIFKNNKKTEDKHPDFNLMIDKYSPAAPREDHATDLNQNEQPW